MFHNSQKNLCGSIGFPYRIESNDSLLNIAMCVYKKRFFIQFTTRVYQKKKFSCNNLLWVIL